MLASIVAISFMSFLAVSLGEGVLPVLAMILSNFSGERGCIFLLTETGVESRKHRKIKQSQSKLGFIFPLINIFFFD